MSELTDKIQKKIDDLAASASELREEIANCDDEIAECTLRRDEAVAMLALLAPSEPEKRGPGRPRKAKEPKP